MAMSWLGCVALLILLAVGWDTPARAVHAQALGQTAPAACERDFDPSTFCHFVAVGTQFQVNSSGLLTRLLGTTPAKQVTLPLRARSRVDLVLWGVIGGDVLMVYEEGDGESGAGAIVRVTAAELRVKWHLRLPAFNVSLGIIEGNRLYQAGLGFVTAVDLDRGVFVWKHQGLYDARQFSFNAFDRPDVGPTDVVFRESVATGVDGRRRVIRVNKDSGKMRLE
jgi:hypothetical protein